MKSAPWVIAGLLALVVACGGGETASAPTSTTTTSTPATTPTTSAVDGAFVPPDWLGTRVLDVDPDTGFGVVRPTPPELVDRRFQAPDALPPPPGGQFVSTVAEVSDEVLGRSTWHPGCPVAAADLRYVTVAFIGFDGRPHTGELLLNVAAVDITIDAFEQAYEAGFPIEEMRIVRADELDLPPTGDTNNTTAFVCRGVVGTTTWSQHAYGLAIDVNPFHNPYVKGEIVLPELASAYIDRSEIRPGMIVAGSPVAEAFTGSGWGWGGKWNSLKDHMHFSANGR